MHYPEGQLCAGHIPADLLPPGTDPRQVVIVQPAPRSYKGPILLTIALTGGLTLIILMIAVTAHVVAAATVAVLSATSGVTLSIKRPKLHSK